MTKTLVKFQKDQYKTVGGVAPTRYPLSIHIVKDNARKMAKFNFQKSDKNNLRIISKPHAYLQTMRKTPVKFQKNRYRTVGGVAPTRYPLLKGDRRTDGRTEGRKDGEAKTKYLCFSSKRRGATNRIHKGSTALERSLKIFLLEGLS